MSLRCLRLHCEWTVVVFISACFISSADIFRDDADIHRCTSGFQEYADGSSNSSQRICSRIMFSNSDESSFSAMNWVEASAACRSMFSFLMDTDARYYNTSSMREDLSNSGLELVWVGIRKMSGFYTWETSYKRLFHTMDGWGNDWQNDEEPVDDCVAMNVSGGFLMTFPCDTIELPVVCMNNGFSIEPFDSIICEDEWQFSYQLDHNSERCIKAFSPELFSTARAQCRQEGGELVSAEDFQNLYHTLEANYLGNITSKAYWVSNSSGIPLNESNYLQNEECQLRGKTAPPQVLDWILLNCSDAQPFICKRPITKNLDVKSEIHPYALTSFSSTDMNYKELTCLAVTGNPSTFISDPLLTYQWHKNGIPVSKSYVIHPASVYDDSKENGDFVSRQGTFQCEAVMQGILTSTKSQRLNVFFSDVSTFVLTISGASIPYNISQDFSRPSFELTFNLLRRPIDAFVAVAQEVFPQSAVFWDLQSISSDEIETTVVALLFFNWTSDTGYSRPFREKKDVHDPLFYALEVNSHLFDEWGSTSITLKSADVCFSQSTTVQSSTNETVTVTWPETFQSSSVASNPICRNGLKIQTRTCVGSVVNGAQWTPFNYSTCTKFEASTSDFVDPCPEGFTYLNNKYCIQYHSTERSWSEALQMCAQSLTYLADEKILRDFYSFGGYSKDKENRNEVWLSYRSVHGIVQPFGISTDSLSIFESIPIETTFTKLNFKCLSTLYTNVKNQVLINNRRCNDSLPFACVMKPMKLSSVPMCPKEWSGSYYHDQCYHIDSRKVEWRTAVNLCQTKQPDSQILELQSRQSYSLLKSFIRDSYQVKKATAWWMGLKSYGKTYEWLRSNNSYTNFVDWHKDTNFLNNDSAGVITYDGNVKASSSIKWDLEDTSSMNGFICELTKSATYRSAYARIVIRSHTLSTYQKSTIEMPVLHCHLSGDFVTDSIAWFKDGFPIPNQNGSYFALSHKSLHFKDVVQLQGYYHCSVFQVKPFQRVFSEKFLYKAGSHESKLRVGTMEIKTFAIDIDSKYNFEKVCLNYSFGYLKDSTPEFLEQLNSLLNVSHTSHLHLKNISCHGSGTNILLHLHILTTSQDSRRYVDHNARDHAIIHEQLTKTTLPALDSWFHFYKVNKSDISVRNTVSCYEEGTVCGHKNVTWPDTPLLKVAVPVEMCVTDAGDIVYRRCLGNYNTGAYWGPIQGECGYRAPLLTVALHKLSEEIVSKDNRVNVSYLLSQLTSASEDLKSADIHYIAKTLANVARDPVDEIEVIRFSAKSVNNVLEADPTVLRNSQTFLNTSSRIAESFERIAFSANLQNRSYQLAMDNVAVNLPSLHLTQNHTIPVGTVAYSVAGHKIWNVSTVFSGSPLPLTGIEAGIVLPTDLVLNKSLENGTDGNRRLSFVIYRKPGLFQYRNEATVVSSVVHAFVGEEYVMDLDPQVQMVFRLSSMVNLENIELTRCAFWDQRLNGNLGSWSKEGCSSVAYFNGSLQCQCDHLTSFAVILEQSSVHAISRSHRVSLSIITFTGCCLSIFGLGMTILTFAVFRKWRRGHKHQTLCNLSVALLCVLIIFLLGIDKKESPYGCLVVAILLHYFMLASFAWMLVEAVIQYLNFVKVYGYYIPRFMQKAMLFAWGMPLVIVSILLSIDYELYNSQHKYCWLSTTAFYCTFALPVLLMLVTNLTIFILILYSITCGRDKTLRNNQDEKKQALTCVRAAFCIFVLLGLSWLFGFMAIDGAQLVFHYLFAISTTLQGFFIFLLFVVQERTARELWQNLIFPYKVQAKSPHTSSSTSNMSLSRGTHKRQK